MKIQWWIWATITIEVIAIVAIEAYGLTHWQQYAAPTITVGLIALGYTLFTGWVLAKRTES